MLQHFHLTTSEMVVDTFSSSINECDLIITTALLRNQCQIPNMIIECLQGYLEIEVKFQI